MDKIYLYILSIPVIGNKTLFRNNVKFIKTKSIVTIVNLLGKSDTLLLGVHNRLEFLQRTFTFYFKNEMFQRARS